METSIKRDPYTDIIKGIGIISIVVGHGAGYIGLIHLNLTTFVYLYHMMLFFFAAGFSFKKEHSQQPYLYIGKRIGSLLPLFVLYALFFAMIHNTLVFLNLLENPYVYSWDDVIYCFFNSCAFQYTDELMGACWFVPVYIIAVGLFCVLFSFAEKSKHPFMFHIILTVFAAVLGIYVQKMNLVWHMQTSVLAVPVMYGGYFVKQHWNSLKKYVPKWGFIPAAILLYWIAISPIEHIELARNQIISPWLFYPVTAVGMYFCMSLGRFIDGWNLPQKLFAYIGKNSFHIMALHFLAFKIIDFIYGNLTLADPSVIRKFPTAFGALWPVYNVAGTILPLIFIGVGRMVVKLWKGEKISFR